MSRRSNKTGLRRALKLAEKDGLRRPGRTSMEVLPTGLLGFDAAIGGGLVRGKIYEVAGDEHSGKTTLCLEIAKMVQRDLGLAVLYMDHEHTLDPAYARKIGVDVDNPDLWIFEQPDTLEEGMELGSRIIQTGAVGLYVADSVAGMTPKGEKAEDFDFTKGSRVPEQALALSPRVRSYVGLLSRTNTVGLFVNQTRVSFNTWGKSGTTTPGGRALKFFASVRMFMYGGRSKIESNAQAGGRRIQLFVQKNKTNGGECGKAEYELLPGQGIIRGEELLKMAKAEGFITERQGIFTLDGIEKKIRGRAKMLEFLADDRGRQWFDEKRGDDSEGATAEKEPG